MRRKRHGCVHASQRGLHFLAGERRADGLFDHGARRHDVLIQERRRYLQRLGDIVETVADIVAGKQRRRVHFDAEHVSHRVFVLGAIQAMNAHAAWVNIRRGGFVQRVL